jgi:hypothetical protein
MTADELTYRPPTKAVLLFGGLAIVGGVTLADGLYRAPQRTWINVLLVSYYLVGLGLGGLLLVALHYVTGARWSLPLRRVPEAMTAVLPVAAVGLAAVLLVGLPCILGRCRLLPQAPSHRCSISG